MEDDGSNGTTEDKQQTKKKLKIPPIIIVDKISNYSQCINSIKSVCKVKDIRIDYSATKLTIHPGTMEDSESLQAKLNEDKVSYYTYTPKWMRKKRIIAKRLPNLPPEDIKEDLRRQGLICDQIIILKKKSTVPTPYNDPIYMLTFAKNVYMKKVWDLKYLCQVKVTWDTYRNLRKVTQCYN